MTFFFISFILSLFSNDINSKSEDYYYCLNPENPINSNGFCQLLDIPASDGYKCCTMAVKYDKETSYNCIAIQTEYTKNQQTLNEYISKRNLDYLFTSSGGEFMIDCGSPLVVQKAYKKYSEPFLNCYDYHLQGVENKSYCYENDIPEDEGSKCCFLEKNTKNNNGNIINDKRCYIIDETYLSDKKNLNDYLLAESNLDDLKYINNTNITINCKNYKTFYFKSNSLSYLENPGDDETNPGDNQEKNDKKKSGLQTWIIIVIVIGGCIIIIGGFIILIIKCRKKNLDQSNNTIITEPGIGPKA